jgi:hypothetical protein
MFFVYSVTKLPYSVLIQVRDGIVIAWCRFRRCHRFFDVRYLLFSSSAYLFVFPISSFLLLVRVLCFSPFIAKSPRSSFVLLIQSVWTFIQSHHTGFDRTLVYVSLTPFYLSSFSLSMFMIIFYVSTIHIHTHSQLSTLSLPICLFKLSIDTPAVQ